MRYLRMAPVAYAALARNVFVVEALLKVFTLLLCCGVAGCCYAPASPASACMLCAVCTAAACPRVLPCLPAMVLAAVCAALSLWCYDPCL